MKARVMLNAIVVTTLLLSRTVFAGPDAENQDIDMLEASGSTASDVEAITAALQNKLENENYTEVAMRIKMDSHQQLSRQLDASALLVDEIQNSPSLLKISINNAENKVRLTAR